MEIEEPPKESSRELPDTPYMPSPDQYLSSLPQDGNLPPAHKVLRRARRPRGSRRRAWPKIVVAVLLVAVLTTLAYGVYVGSIVAKISTNPLSLQSLAGDSGGRVNILVLGEGDPGHAGENLTDTMMVISLDTTSHRAAQISIPRDLRVEIPGYGEAKINSANADGGVSLAEQTVSNTLGIPIHYYMLSNFSGLKDVVNAVGGIDVDVKQRLVDTEYPCDDNQYLSCGLDIEPGMQHMDGARALQYVRCRKGTCGDDFGRAARQQEVLSLVRAKVVKWDVLLNPAKLTAVVNGVRTGIQTDMDAIQLLEFARSWQDAGKNQSQTFVPSITNGYLTDAGSSDLVPTDGDFSAIQQRVQTIFDSR